MSSDEDSEVSLIGRSSDARCGSGVTSSLYCCLAIAPFELMMLLILVRGMQQTAAGSRSPFEILGGVLSITFANICFQYAAWTKDWGKFKSLLLALPKCKGLDTLQVLRSLTEAEPSLQYLVSVTDGLLPGTPRDDDGNLPPWYSTWTRALPFTCWTDASDRLTIEDARPLAVTLSLSYVCADDPTREHFQRALIQLHSDCDAWVASLERRHPRCKLCCERLRPVIQEKMTLHLQGLSFNDGDVYVLHGEDELPAWMHWSVYLLSCCFVCLGTVYRLLLLYYIPQTELAVLKEVSVMSMIDGRTLQAARRGGLQNRHIFGS
mmetsp:Transcript_58104/g.129726  ORF Transcript_58104/g.129726 Transcript_58104/m.129726 type:complete len:321 (+) Transcript_58104:62-1024(+)